MLEQEALRATLAHGAASEPAAAVGRTDGGLMRRPASSQSPLVLAATDGELYGHHQKFRDLFLHRLVVPQDGAGGPQPDRGFDIVALAASRRTLLVVGQIAPFKGTHLVVDAGLRLLEHHADVQILIVGAVPTWPKGLVEYARDLEAHAILAFVF